MKIIFNNVRVGTLKKATLFTLLTLRLVVTPFVECKSEIKTTLKLHRNYTETTPKRNFEVKVVIQTLFKYADVCGFQSITNG